MFISALELFKIGIGPSSSHTMGPMVAAADFRTRIERWRASEPDAEPAGLRCVLKGSLAYTGKGHATDRAITLGLNGYAPSDLAEVDVNGLVASLQRRRNIELPSKGALAFDAERDIVFDRGQSLPEHPNGIIFELLDIDHNVLLTETYFSIGGGFINTLAQIGKLQAPLQLQIGDDAPFGFDSAKAMLTMARESGLSIAQMKQHNEVVRRPVQELNQGLDAIWRAMRICIERGLDTQGELPGGLHVQRRAMALYAQLREHPAQADMNDWLCAYAMAVNEENAAGRMVVTAPTNGAAGVIPAVLYYWVEHHNGTAEQVRTFLLTAAAIGGLIKHLSSISGAEVGCQGEVGSAAAMAAAGLCAVQDGTPLQVENAAEIALEHHLGMTCDPVGGLVQVPCIERNGFGAIKAYTAASLARRGSGQHFMPLDNCIAAMKQTGQEMSDKYKETSQGGLAVSFTEC